MEKNICKINENILNDFSTYSVNIEDNKNSNSSISSNIDVNVRKLYYPDNTETFEVSVAKDSVCTVPIEVTYNSLIADLRKINNMGIYLIEPQIYNIASSIKENIDCLNVKLAEVHPGFNIRKDKIQNFQAGCTIDSKGNCFKNDLRDGFPATKGKFDISFINTFATDEKHQLLLLHPLIAPIMGFLAVQGQSFKIPIMALSSPSSCERDLASKLAISLAISPDFDRTNLDYKNRQKEIFSCLSSNFGVPVCIYNIDKKSSSSYIKLLSDLSTPVYSSGEKVIQLNAYTKRNYTNGTTILLTTKTPLFSQICLDSLDVFSGVFPLDFKEGELFKDSASLLRVKTYIDKNQGVVLPEIVHQMMKTNFDALLQTLNRDTKDLQDKLICTTLSNYTFSKDVELLFYEWGFYFAALKMVTKILSTVYSLNWDADKIIQYMLDTLLKTLKKKNCFCIDNLIVDEFYPLLLENKYKEGKDKDNQTIVYVKNSTFKKLSTRFLDDWGIQGYSHLKLKDILVDKKLMIAFAPNKFYKNVDSKTVCYGLVKMKEEAV